MNTDRPSPKVPLKFTAICSLGLLFSNLDQLKCWPKEKGGRGRRWEISLRDSGSIAALGTTAYTTHLPVQGHSLGPQSLQNTVPASNEVIHAVVNFLEGGVKLQWFIHWYGGVRVLWKKRRHLINFAAAQLLVSPPQLTTLPLGQGQAGRTARGNGSRIKGTWQRLKSKAEIWGSICSLRGSTILRLLSLQMGSTTQVCSSLPPLHHSPNSGKIFYFTFRCRPFLKSFTEFVTILLLFHALVFWPWGMRDLSSRWGIALTPTAAAAAAKSL